MDIASQTGAAMAKPTWPTLALAWLVGNVAAYFLTSFFSNFYPSLYQFVILGFVFLLLCGTGTYLVQTAIFKGLPSKQQNDWFAIFVLGIALFLGIAATWIARQFPGLFHREILFMDSSRLGLFFLLSLLCFVAFVSLLNRWNQRGLIERLEQTQSFHFIQENWLGSLLAIFFFFTYFVFAESINFPQFRTLDLYFDTDISEWLKRLTYTSLEDVSIVRAVHPAILLFLRPPVWFLSLFLQGERLHAVFLMSALAGAGCVLLAWHIIKRASGDQTYALIIASLLGASFSHLLLSSMFETYIYSALALLFFIFLLQSQKTTLQYTVPAGVLVFGITVTNIVQTCILYLFQHPRIKVIIKYVLLVVVITALLNMIQVWLYPNARSFFVPSNLMHEQRYISNPLEFSWRSIGRFQLIIRAILLYGIVAPTPFVLMEEIGMDVPNFRTYQILLGEFHVAGYRGFADVTVKFWLFILAIAGILFIWNVFKAPRQMLLPLSLLGCLGFSFILHLIYGDDPLLYSPNWVYALVLFVGLALQQWANKRWLQFLMLIFLILLLYTNLASVYQILDVSAPFYSTGQ